MISSEDVHRLRDQTGCGLGECRDALQRFGGYEQAADYLRTKGFSRPRPADLVDYRRLLAKYINHIGAWEGVTYIKHAKEPEFTKAEIAALIAAEQEA